MSDPTPEREVPELPDEVETALGHALNTWYGYGKVNGNLNRKPAHDAMMSLRQAILAALEPDRTLRQRAERLRRVADAASISIRVPDIVLEVLTDLHDGDLAGNILTATSSTHEGRE